ncbi:MAG: epoxyqueuosine reductase QueH [Candidatus Scalinduaceae bacterium]
MNLLLHICCAGCLCAPLEELRKENIYVHGYFYNPNIHPLLEFRKRLKAVHIFQESDPLIVDYCEEYGLMEYLKEVDYEGENSPHCPSILLSHRADTVQESRGDRCEDCYRLRLRTTACYAREKGFDAFSSTLLFSEHQDHERVKKVGEQVSEQIGISFEYRDYRYLCECSREIASKKMLYKQSYCGCIFSEYERYKDTTRNLYQGWKLRGDKVPTAFGKKAQGQVVGKDNYLSLKEGVQTVRE